MAATVGVWKKVVEVVETGPDTGDILAPLKRVKEQYGKRATRHEAAGRLQCAEYYNEQAANVERMIVQ